RQTATTIRARKRKGSPPTVRDSLPTRPQRAASRFSSAPLREKCCRTPLLLHRLARFLDRQPGLTPRGRAALDAEDPRVTPLGEYLPGLGRLTPGVADQVNRLVLFDAVKIFGESRQRNIDRPIRMAVGILRR